MRNDVLAIEGTYNFRDLGELRAGDRHTRTGLLFRSDSLARLAASGQAQLQELGVTRVIDLRDDLERQIMPDALPAGIEFVAHPIFPSASAHVARQLDIFSLTDLIYAEHADTLAAGVTMLADGGPTVFHCTAGKDRTGAIAALTLLALGVDRDDVLTNYEASEAHLRGAWFDEHVAALRAHGVDVTPVVEQLVGASPAAALDRTLTTVVEARGGAFTYLRAAGVTEATFERLNARFTE
ncbi:tyrosine-protein phosphatase [Leucobacter salsicius]|uniref:tyrosine-protein phosphatase n=1 Tax=Leucobacter salsicius TaxID=664638 RepID=UPI0003450A92|nr:tyrosine-protein phosphatase [Leucobacter salsicius]